jgi:hypothetical protein
MAADDAMTSTALERKRAGTAARRSQSGAGIEIETSPGELALTITASDAGAA